MTAREPQTWRYEELFFGIITGILIGIALAYVLAPHYFQQDCGCGAAVQAARNCIASHDWNSSWCGWLR